MSNGILIERHSEAPTLKKITPGIYKIRSDKDSMALLRQPLFELPKKIYGAHHERKALIIDTLSRRDSSVGVLLLGLKGTGKSVLCHDLCNTAVKQKHPVFLIDDAVTAEALKFLYELVDGECVFFFDEFDKNYDDEDRDKLLTFFSDPNIKRALFLVAQNEEEKLPDAFINRTGRFLFRFDHTRLKEAEAKEIIDDLIADSDTAAFLLDYVAQQELTPNLVIDLCNQINLFGGRYGLDVLLNSMNVPRPSWANVRYGVAFNPESPLPTGWSWRFVRTSTTDYQLQFVGPLKQVVEVLDVEIPTPRPGRSGEYVSRRLYTSEVFDTVIAYHIDIKVVGVGTLKEYKKPLEVPVEWPAEKEENDE